MASPQATVRRLDGTTAKAVRDAEVVSEDNLADGDPENTLVIEVPSNLPTSTVRRLVSKLDRPVSADVFDTLVGELGHPHSGQLRQAELAAQRLRDLDDEFGMLDSHQVAAQARSSSRNRSALATRWARESRIFAVKVRGKQLFAAFQFDAEGRPLSVIKDVINAYGPAAGTGLAIWFTAANGHLDGARPVDLLTSDPQAVVHAASQAQQAGV